MPQLFLTAAGSATPVISPNNSRRFQSNDPSAVAKENIRERLNMHVKKRIQGQDIYPTSPPNSSHLYSHQFDRDSTATLRPTNPFLMSGNECDSNCGRFKNIDFIEMFVCERHENEDFNLKCCQFKCHL